MKAKEEKSSDILVLFIPEDEFYDLYCTQLQEFGRFTEPQFCICEAAGAV